MLIIPWKGLKKKYRTTTKRVKAAFFSFRNNQLSDLPPEMENLTKLRSITLNYNR